MNLTLLLDMAADGFGDRVLVGSRRDGITAARLQEMSHSGAAELAARGARAVVYVAVNGPAFPVAMFAAARAGVPLVPVNYRLGEAQLEALIARHPGALGIAEGAAADSLRRAGVEVVSPSGWLELAGRPADAGAPDGPEGAEGPAVVIYTSGTTSAPKGVLLRHENLTSYVIGSVEFAGAAEDEAALVSVPPYHIAAVANVISNLYAGRRVVVLAQFEPARWLTVAREEAVTNALVVPTMLARLLEAADGSGVPGLRALAYGGAPVSARVIEQALRQWPDVDFVNAYGLTETSSTVAVLGPEEHRVAAASDDPRVRARLGSVGRPVPGVELEIRGDDDEVVAAGITGRICVRGDQVSAEYAGLGRMVDDRGFFDTRDQGYLDEDGFLFIGGRTDDTIIRGAENIAPAEIEEVVLRHPGVADVAVVGVPDEEWGQRIEAAVVARPGSRVDGAEIREFVRTHLRSSKTPDRVEVWEEIPRTETGKLVRRRVAERLLTARNGTAQNPPSSAT